VSPAESGLGSWDGYPGFRVASPWAIIVAALRARSIEGCEASLTESSRAEERRTAIERREKGRDAGLRVGNTGRWPEGQLYPCVAG